MVDAENLDIITELKVNQFWRIVYGFPIPIMVLNVILNIYWHTEDSLNFHILKSDKKKALAMIQKIYHQKESHLYETIYNDLESNLKKA